MNLLLTLLSKKQKLAVTWHGSVYVKKITPLLGLPNNGVIEVVNFVLLSN